LVVTKADRIARSAAHLLTTVCRKLKQEAVSVRFLDQPELNTEGKYADFLLTVLRPLPRIER
jgi:DNA invertase Pin-like site-specific DNA recombinase